MAHWKVQVRFLLRNLVQLAAPSQYYPSLLTSSNSLDSGKGELVCLLLRFSVVIWTFMSKSILARIRATVWPLIISWFVLLLCSVKVKICCLDTLRIFGTVCFSCVPSSFKAGKIIHSMICNFPIVPLPLHWQSCKRKIFLVSSGQLQVCRILSILCSKGLKAAQTVTPDCSAVMHLTKYVFFTRSSGELDDRGSNKERRLENLNGYVGRIPSKSCSWGLPLLSWLPFCFNSQGLSSVCHPSYVGSSAFHYSSKSKINYSFNFIDNFPSYF